MSSRVVRQQGSLPDKPDALAKFILAAPERLKTVQEEILAIQRLDLAKEVYDQKVEEQARLQELTLLASQRMGEITRKMSTSAGGRPSAKKSPSTVKTKAQAIHDLGLSTSQVGRMEQIAAHPDIVEKVIAESQAGQAEATQTEVLRRIKRLNGVHDADTEEGHQENANLRLFRRAINSLVKLAKDALDSIVAGDRTLCIDIDRVGEAIRLLTDLQERLLEEGQASSRYLFESIALKEDLSEPEPLPEIVD